MFMRHIKPTLYGCMMEYRSSTQRVHTVYQVQIKYTWCRGPIEVQPRSCKVHTYESTYIPHLGIHKPVEVRIRWQLLQSIIATQQTLHGGSGGFQTSDVEIWFQHWIHLPEKKLVIADALSRAPLMALDQHDTHLQEDAQAYVDVIF